MGLTKRFAEDCDELGSQAANAALLAAPAERLQALTDVFEEAGERAARYYDPARAVDELVKTVVQRFHLVIEIERTFKDV